MSSVPRSTPRGTWRTGWGTREAHVPSPGCACGSSARHKRSCSVSGSGSPGRSSGAAARWPVRPVVASRAGQQRPDVGHPVDEVAVLSSSTRTAVVPSVCEWWPVSSVLSLDVDPSKCSRSTIGASENRNRSNLVARAVDSDQGIQDGTTNRSPLARWCVSSPMVMSRCRRTPATPRIPPRVGSGWRRRRAVDGTRRGWSAGHPHRSSGWCTGPRRVPVRRWPVVPRPPASIAHAGRRRCVPTGTPRSAS